MGRSLSGPQQSRAHKPTVPSFPLTLPLLHVASWAHLPNKMLAGQSFMIYFWAI